MAALAEKVKAIVERSAASAKLTDVALPPAAVAKRVDVTVNTLGPDAGSEIDGAWGVTRDGVVKKVVNGILLADGSVHVGEATNALIVASDVAFVDKCASCIVIAGGRIDVLHVVTAPAPPAAKKGEELAAKRSVLLSGGELTSADANGALLGSGDATTLVKENDVIQLAGNGPDLVLASRRTLATIEAGASTSTPAAGEAVVRAKEGRSGRKTLLGKPPMTRKGPIPGTEGWTLAQVTEKLVAFRNDDVFAVLPVIPIDRSAPPGKAKAGDEDE